MPEKRIFPLPDELKFKSDDESEKFEGGTFWKNFHRKIFNCKDFDELSQLIDETEILRICLQRKMKMGPQEQEDRIAKFLLPQDIEENLVPVKCKGDGNCMPRSLSHACFGTERRHREIRCRMIIDAVKNICHHTDNEKLYMGAISRLPSMEITNFYAFIMPGYDIVHPKEVNEASVLEVYKVEVIRIIKPKTWMSMWHFHWTSSATGLLIRVVYLMFNLCNRNYFNRYIYPLEKKNGDNNIEVTVMWSSTNDVNLTIDYFVPLMHRK